MKTLKVRNKKVIQELLQYDVTFEKISLATNLEQDDVTKAILSTAKKKGVVIEEIPIKKMDKRRSGQTREVIIGCIVPNNIWTLDSLLDDIYKKNKDPFFLLINRVDFESNIGVIARTAFAAGVNGLIFQGNEDEFLNDETLHFSMGTIARIPLVKMSVFEALKELRKNNIKTFCLQMDGNVYYNENFSGPVAFVLGSEREGVSNEITKKCDKNISIPMQHNFDSLNVGVSAGIILYEKIRQDKN